MKVTFRPRLPLAMAALPVGLLFALLPVQKPNSSQSQPPQKTKVTFNKDIAPIIFDHCSSCHRPDTAAPFSLLNFQDVSQRGKFIDEVVRQKYMPPWKPGPCSFPFENQNSLSDHQIQLINRWVSEGMPKGDGEAPPPPSFYGNWQLGQPDRIVQMPKAFQVPATGPDVYRNFVIPLHLPEGVYIKAIEFHPSARRVVHHCLFFYDSSGYAASLDGKDGQPGFDGLMAIAQIALHSGGNNGQGALAITSFGGSGTAQDHTSFGSLGGWAVGADAIKLPAGLAYYLPKGSDIILSTHFHPDGKVESERSEIGIYYSKEPPRQPFTTILLPPVFGAVSGIDIPAGQSQYTITDSIKLPAAVKAFGVAGHAHYLGKTMLLTATLPSGKTETLLNIPDWDFNWQGQYQYKNPVSLPAGTVLKSTITYDNSINNPHQPSNPPKQVWWGEQTTDEMGSLILLLYPDDPKQMGSIKMANLFHLQETYMAHRGHLHGLGESRN